MKIEVISPYQASITFEDGAIKVVGSLQLLERLKALKNEQGVDPRAWMLIKPVLSNHDIFINQFIKAFTPEKKEIYEHEELCHCRMVPTQKVKNAIIQGCQTVAEISKSTLACTGCGSCRQDIENILKSMI